MRRIHSFEEEEYPPAKHQDSSAESTTNPTVHSAEGNSARDSTDNPYHYYNGHHPYYSGWPFAPANGNGIDYPQPPWASRGSRDMPQPPEEWQDWPWTLHPLSQCTCPCTGPENTCSGSADTCPNLPTNTASGRNNTGTKEPQDNNSGNQKPGKRNCQNTARASEGLDGVIRNPDGSHTYMNGSNSVTIGCGPNSGNQKPGKSNRQNTARASEGHDGVIRNPDGSHTFRNGSNSVTIGYGPQSLPFFPPSRQYRR